MVRRNLLFCSLLAVAGPASLSIGNVAASADLVPRQLPSGGGVSSTGSRVSTSTTTSSSSPSSTTTTTSPPPTTTTTTNLPPPTTDPTSPPPTNGPPTQTTPPPPTTTGGGGGGTTTGGGGGTRTSSTSTTSRSPTDPADINAEDQNASGGLSKGAVVGISVAAAAVALAAIGLFVFRRLVLAPSGRFRGRLAGGGAAGGDDDVVDVKAEQRASFLGALSEGQVPAAGSSAAGAATASPYVRPTSPAYSSTNSQTPALQPGVGYAQAPTPEPYTGYYAQGYGVQPQHEEYYANYAQHYGTGGSNGSVGGGAAGVPTTQAAYDQYGNAYAYPHTGEYGSEYDARPQR
ncbi:hypothetical protein HK104_001950 [Borealophlyctis nickersoniae]|nr:hypothetical protein HK104_001950 [Borealophlyctis nickersoniae]